MHPLMRALALAIDQSLVTAQQLKLDAVEQLLTMASLEISARIEILERNPERSERAGL
ncbi:MAG: hypothetical protein WC670_05965 [Pseudolabrys sp.]|jgi:hypothetical protein